MNVSENPDSQSSRANDLRRKAEDHLRADEARPDEITSLADARALLHELQVHQIELQMQNEELQRARLEAEEASEKYLDLFDFAPAGHFLWDHEGRILEINLAGAALLGLERSAASQKRFGQFVAADFRGAFAEFLARVLATDAKQICEVVIQSAGSSAVWVLVEGIAAQDRREPRRLCRAAVIDITQQKRAEESAANRALEAEMAERKRAEAALAHERDLLQSVLDSAGKAHLVCLDRDFNFVRVNETYAVTCGYRPAEMVGKNYFALYPGVEIEAIFHQVRDTGEAVEIHDRPFEFPGQPERGVTYWDWTLVPVKDAGAQVTGLIFSLFETTARVRAEAALRGSEERYRVLFDSMTEGFALHEIVTDELDRPVDYRYIDVNPAFERLTGLNRADLLGKRVLEVLPALEAHWIETFGRVALTGEPVHFENHAAELSRWYGVFAYRPAPRQFAVVFTDITARKQAEEALQASLSEKDVLLHEVHHRVKNNLQVISSLISIQTDALTGPERATVGNIRDQIRAMVLVHEQLYQADDFRRIEFAGYAQKLLMQLWRAHGEIASTAELRLDFEPVTLPLTSAVPCGLILNELAGNALKHAFRGRPGGGQVVISLRAEPEGQAFLRVTDNGAGLPEGFDWRNAQSLGLRLVQMLVGQVGGTVEARSADGGGISFEVRFGIRNG